MKKAISISAGGIVPAKRHTNPDGTEGGWVADTASVAPSAYVGPHARVSGNARVSGDARVSVTPIVIQGTEYAVTVCDAPHVCVGCQVATLEQWEAGHAPETCPKLEAMRPYLIAIAKLHHAQLEAKGSQP